MTWNYIPLFGWIVSFVGNASLAIPFWFFWTYYGLGAMYFSFIPKVYQSIPFLNCIGLFIIIAILKSVLVPSFVNVSQSVDKKS